ncbi:MAG: hypothetical protein AAF654_08560 [Myxococcota bacterium]
MATELSSDRLAQRPVTGQAIELPQDDAPLTPDDAPARSLTPDDGGGLTAVQVRQLIQESNAEAFRSNMRNAGIGATALAGAGAISYGYGGQGGFSIRNVPGNVVRGTHAAYTGLSKGVTGLFRGVGTVLRHPAGAATAVGLGVIAAYETQTVPW